MQLAARISASPQFRRTAKLRDFLLYVVDQTVQGQGDTLTEQQIGRAVFNRAADYSPSEDNVVRAHARQLRVKLGEYFAAAGKDEPVILEIPKGSYVPVFSEKPAVAPVPAEGPALSRAFVRGPVPALWSTTSIAALAIALCVLLAVQNGGLRRQIATAPATTPLPAPLAWVFDSERTTFLAVADSSFGLIQDLAGRPATLDEYVDPKFWQSVKPSTRTPGDERLMRRLRSRELTSYADILLTARILHMVDPRTRVAIRFARDINPRDLNAGNFILLGSSFSNPWVSLFDRKRNFRIQVDSASMQGRIVNKNPRRDERPTYLMLGEDGVPGATYGLIAFCPSDGSSGNALIIEGTNMEGTEAAGSMILDPQSAHALLAKAGVPERGSQRVGFEILLETKALAGAPSQTRVVASRVAGQ